MRMLLSLILLGSSPAMAWQQLTCSTEYPTTTFQMRKTDKDLLVTVVHHNGVRYAPFWFNPVVSTDLDILARKANSILKLENTWRLRWPLAKCKFKDGLRFECFGGATSDDATSPAIEPFAIYSSLVTEDGIAGIQKTTVVALNFDVEKEDQTISMVYRDDSQDCYTEEKTKPVKR